MTSERASGTTEPAVGEANDGVEATDGFLPLRIRAVTRETVDAVSLTLDLPTAVEERFDYQAGQFITVCVPIGAQLYRRCYSMSSAPSMDKGLRITVKRSIDGPVSNWINDHVRAGDVLNVLAPEGRFVLDSSSAPLVAFAGGSGITPILSLIRTALHTTERRAKLLYANRDRASIIFREELDDLVNLFGDRLAVRHHLDVDSGFLTRDRIVSFLDGVDAEFYICGPRKFMDTAENAVAAVGADPKSVHLERFEIAEITPSAEIAAGTPTTREVTIRLGRQKVTVEYRRGNTLLQTARSAGLRAPSSCETGSCGTCMARLLTGSARMVNNDVLDDDEVAEGWVLTCQSLPTSPTVHVTYE